MAERSTSRTNVDHDGWFNPWDMTTEERELHDRCEASGGFVFRTGVYNIATKKYYGDGLCFVRGPEDA